jgi:hypothetical protein
VPCRAILAPCYHIVISVEDILQQTANGLRWLVPPLVDDAPREGGGEKWWG